MSLADLLRNDAVLVIKCGGEPRPASAADRTELLVIGYGCAEGTVREAARLLRGSGAAPPECLIHACTLNVETMAIRIIDQDRTLAALTSTEVPAPPAISSEIMVSFPELPDLPLPNIPELDLDALTAPDPQPAPAAPPEISYGATREGSGPVSFTGVLGLPETIVLQSQSRLSGTPSPEAQGIGFELPVIHFQVPEGVQIRDTGLGRFPGPSEPALEPAGEKLIPQARSALEARAGITARPSVKERESIQARESIKTRARSVIPDRRQGIESPQTTKEVVRAAPQQPPGEGVLPPAARSEDGVHVDLPRGFVALRGADMPLAADLQQALLKVQRFLAAELSSAERRNIAGQIRHKSAEGAASGELLKPMIASVLRLGKKRYAVINDLLKIKEVLPRMDPPLVQAILLETLRN